MVVTSYLLLSWSPVGSWVCGIKGRGVSGGLWFGALPEVTGVKGFEFPNEFSEGCEG